VDEHVLINVLREDLHKLSTEDLVICWAFLYRIRRRARREGNGELAGLCAGRMLLIDGEIGVRQLTLDDELARLKAENALGRGV
jgi:hypothetical protein